MSKLSLYREVEKGFSQIAEGENLYLRCLDRHCSGSSCLPAISKLLESLGFSLEQIAQQWDKNNPRYSQAGYAVQVKNGRLYVHGCCLNMRGLLDLIAEIIESQLEE